MKQDARIVVVDNDEMVCKALVRLLRNEGMSVTSFTAVEDALEAAGTEQCAVLICDQHLAGGGAMELMEAYQAQNPDTMKILLASHMATVPSLIRQSQGLKFQVMLKPWSNMDMVRTILTARSRYLAQEMA